MIKTYGLLLLSGGGALSASLLLALTLLEKGLRDQDVVVGRDGTVARVRLVRSPAQPRARAWNRERRCENCSLSATFCALADSKLYLIGENKP